MARYSIVGRTTNSPTATLPGASLYAAAAVAPKVKEIGIYNTAATACVISVNRLTTAGTQGSGITAQKVGDTDVVAASSGGFQSHTGTPPTLGAELVRCDLAAAIGSAMVWTFPDDDPLRIPTGTGNGIGFLCPTGTGQVLDFYIVFVE